MSLLASLPPLLAQAADHGHDAAHGAESEGILQIFGIQWPLMLAQLITVGIVFFILQKFAFGPITKVLADRRERIREADERAVRIEKQLAETEARTATALQEANAKADRLIAEAKDAAHVAGDQARAAATREAAALIDKARQAASLERDQLITEIKRDFGRLVVETTAAVTGKHLTDDDQRRLNEEATAALN